MDIFNSGNDIMHGKRGFPVKTTATCKWMKIRLLILAVVNTFKLIKKQKQNEKPDCNCLYGNSRYGM